MLMIGIGILNILCAVRPPVRSVAEYKKIYHPECIKKWSYFSGCGMLITGKRIRPYFSGIGIVITEKRIPIPFVFVLGLFRITNRTEYSSGWMR